MNCLDLFYSFFQTPHESNHAQSLDHYSSYIYLQIHTVYYREALEEQYSSNSLY